jgi:uncharacterized membrane protein
MIFGLPLSLAFLYFIVYSFLGWCMETIYCSLLEKRLVPRGFLYGPICPIYGVGVLMMICWFQPLMGNPVLFYLVATVCMSAWEYLVGWFLETTTHIKYWDYSQYRFNIKGRICLWVCLVWGVLSFIILYFVHPHVATFLSRFQSTSLYFLDGVLLGILIADTTATIYQLVRTSQMLAKLQQAGDELRVQVHLGKAELGQRMDEVKERLEDLVPDQSDEKARVLKERYDELVARTEIMSRRLRHSYGHMTASGSMGEALDSVKRHSTRLARLKVRLEEAKQRRQSTAD